MLKRSIKIILPVLFAAALVFSFGAISAGAAEEDGGNPIRDFISELFDDEDTFPTEPETLPTEPLPTEQPEPETVYTEPEPTEPPVTEAPETETPETEPERRYEPEETESPRDEYVQLLDDQAPTGANAAKMDKSVSNKTYATDNTAGIVSWICVGVGLIVVIVMLVTTKITGKRNYQGNP